MDVIDAESKNALKLANKGLRGDIADLITKKQQELLDIVAVIAVNIDYPEYDDVEEIRTIYNAYQGYNFDLVYGVANTGLNSEIMFLSDQALVPTTSELNMSDIKINFRRCR